MATVTTGQIAKALMPGVQGWYQMEYDRFPSESAMIFTALSSQKQYEERVAVSLLGLASEKPEGQNIEYDDFETSYVARFVNKVYAKGIKLTKETIKDNQYPALARIMQERSTALARSMRETREHVHANVLNRAFTAAYTMGTAHDGQELVASDHPSGPYGGTYSNLVSADLSEAALESALILADGFTDARGLKIKVSGQKLIVPPASRFEAERLMATTMQPGTANNDVNAIRSSSALPGNYMVYHYLTDTDAWFIKTSVDGLITFNSWTMEFGRDEEFDNSNVKFKAEERFSVGWDDPRCIIGSAGI
jgi:phage major head subunit gpT-like protein